MSARSRIVTADEELGKRDDDFFRTRRRDDDALYLLPRASSTSSVFPPWRWRKRRVVIAMAVAAVMVWALVHTISTIPSSPILVEQTGRPSDIAVPVPATVPSRSRTEPAGAPPREWSPEEQESEDETAKHWYNGVVRFYRLGETLHDISARTGGQLYQNSNVLFVASSLRSMANLIPMACEMARMKRCNAHFALFGRSTIPVDELLEINGVHLPSCGVFWHDARGDFPDYSSDARAESATRGAMKHIHDFMHPQALIMDDSAREDDFFTRAMRTKSMEHGRALIEVPAGKYDDFLWLTRLEANSLANWFRPTIDIVIQAPHASSGSLIRLVKSLINADYRGLKVPRLTIELPSEVEHYTLKYLRELQWPPMRDGSSASQASSLTLHHRIPTSRQSSEQASLRFVESFYPTNPEDHHILLLSPQAELHPLFLQYLQWQILDYRYAGWFTASVQALLGLSLDIPSAFLNGTTGFKPPVRVPGSPSSLDARDTPFLYQAPSSSATLIFGDKWSAFHEFLANRTHISHGSKARKLSQKAKKLVSETEPAWAEYLLELMRAKAWSILHPAVTNLVTIHNDLATLPEEFDADAKKVDAEADLTHEVEEFLTSNEPVIRSERAESDSSGSNGVPLHLLLGFEGQLPKLETLPTLMYHGQEATEYERYNAAWEYKEQFRVLYGGCEEGDDGAEELFCVAGPQKD